MDKRKGQGKEQMSKKDTVTKAFMRENTVFADAFNYLIFNGKKVIQPERLQELDTTELVQLIAKGKNNKNESVQKYRDILKAAVIMEDENADYLLLGIENQTEIHYAMPVRNMIYDALQYGNQVAAIAAQNVKEKKAPTRAEFLSGFYKADKLRPVITLVLHFGADPWDGATSLHEMMDFPLEEIYNVATEQIHAHLITEEVIQQFRQKQAIFRDTKKVPIDNLAGHIALVFELEFPQSYEIVKEQGYLDQLLAFQSPNEGLMLQFQEMRQIMQEHLQAMAEKNRQTV